MVVLIAFVSIVLLKAYAIGIVWRCYKYLTMRQHNLRSMLPYIIPHVTSTSNGNNGGCNDFGRNGGIGDRDYSTLLPDYEEAIAQSMKQQPPPSYQVAISNIPNAEQVILPPVSNDDNETNNNNDPVNHANYNFNNNNNNESTNLNSINANITTATVANTASTNPTAAIAASNDITPPPPPYSPTTIRAGSSIVEVSDTNNATIPISTATVSGILNAQQLRNNNESNA